MTEPILVVDMGTAWSAVAIVAQNRTALLRDPGSDRTVWPSSLLQEPGGAWLAAAAAEQRRRMAPRCFVDGPRRALDAGASIVLDGREVSAVEALGGYLSAVAVAARTVYRSPIQRLVLTAPAGWPVSDARRDHLIASGHLAGFTDVELVDDAVAVAGDPQTAAALPEDATVLVVDLGASWTVSSVHVAGERSRVLASRTTDGGRDLDLRLFDDLRTRGRPWVEPMLAAPGDAGLRAGQEAMEFVRKLKHRLADEDVVQGHLTPLTPPHRLDRQWMAALAQPAIDALLIATHEVLLETGTAPGDLAAVLLAGGSARLAVAAQLAEALGQPMRRSAEPEFAAVRGAARWAELTPGRVMVASVAPWRTEPVVWDMPGGRAQLLRWTVEPGDGYPAGAVLAQVRTDDLLVLGLAAPRAGSLTGDLPAAGSIVGPVLAVNARRDAAALAAEPPPLIRAVATAGTFLLGDARATLYECTRGEVRMWSAVTGESLGTFTADFVAGRLFVDPRGRVALISRNAEAGLRVWDVGSRQLTVQIPEVTEAQKVLVDEAGWRVAVEHESRSVGRYRRAAVTVWDLRTGAVLDKVSDPIWEQRHPEFQPRSAGDELATEAVTPDGHLQASVRPGGVVLSDRVAGVVVHQMASTAQAAARVAFVGDGRLLLVNWESQAGSRIDVYRT